jgi:hypothetical protein
LFYIDRVWFQVHKVVGMATPKAAAAATTTVGAATPKAAPTFAALSTPKVVKTKAGAELSAAEFSAATPVPVAPPAPTTVAPTPTAAATPTAARRNFGQTAAATPLVGAPGSMLHALLTGGENTTSNRFCSL